jgi:excisionase family DNA binding protein
VSIPSPIPETVPLRLVAELYGKDESTIRRWIRRGRLPAVMVGGRVCVPLDALSAAVVPVIPKSERP